MRFTTPIKQNHIFRRLYARGASSVGKMTVVYCKPNGTDANRIGFATGTKLGHAVVRNRVRRRLREIYRLNEARFCTGYDVIVVARTRAVDAAYTAIESDFIKQCRALHLLQEDTP